MKQIVFITSLFCVFNAQIASAQTPDPPSSRSDSVLFAIDMGMALNVNAAAREPLDYWGKNTEAIAPGAFLLGIRGGYRFNESWGIEAGWHEQRHNTHEGWETAREHYDWDLGEAIYNLGHLALRAAWPTATQLTPVVKLGPAMGAFSYGHSADGRTKDNTTFVAGGLLGLDLEYELTLGVVAALSLAYTGLYRTGMDEKLVIWIDCNNDDRLTEPLDVVRDGCGRNDQIVDQKDFTEGQMVHSLWVNLSIQFEWAF